MLPSHGSSSQRSNGYFAMVVLSWPQLCKLDQDEVWADYTHIRGFTPGAFRLMFEDVGFHVGRVTPMGGAPLSERLRFVHLLPYLLRVPPFSAFWASSWELVGRKVT